MPTSPRASKPLGTWCLACGRQPIDGVFCNDCARELAVSEMCGHLEMVGADRGAPGIPI